MKLLTVLCYETILEAEQRGIMKKKNKPFRQVASLKTTKPTKERISFPNINLQEWCDKWELEPGSFRCPGCNKVRVIDIPIDYGEEGKGLTSKPCENCSSKNIEDIIVFTGEL